VRVRTRTSTITKTNGVLVRVIVDVRVRDLL